MNFLFFIVCFNGSLSSRFSIIVHLGLKWYSKKKKNCECILMRITKSCFVITSERYPKQVSLIVIQGVRIMHRQGITVGSKNQTTTSYQKIVIYNSSKLTHNFFFIGLRLYYNNIRIANQYRKSLYKVFRYCADNVYR